MLKVLLSFIHFSEVDVEFSVFFRLKFSLLQFMKAQRKTLSFYRLYCKIREGGRILPEFAYREN